MSMTTTDVGRIGNCAPRKWEHRRMSISMWNRPAPPGFQGLREDLPMSVYWRHFPHWRQHTDRKSP